MLLVFARERAPSSLRPVVNHTIWLPLRKKRHAPARARAREVVRRHGSSPPASGNRCGGTADRGVSLARGEDRRLAGRARVSASCCRDRFTGSRLREAFERLTPRVSIAFERGRELHLGVTTSDLRRKTVARALRVTGRISSSDQPITWWGSRFVPDCEQPGSTIRSRARTSGIEGRHLGLFLLRGSSRSHEASSLGFVVGHTLGNQRVIHHRNAIV